MFVDHELLLAEDQAVTVSAGSANIIDLTTVSPKSMGAGEPVHILVQVTGDFAGAANLTVSLEESVDQAFTAPVALVSGPTLATAALKSGKKILAVEVSPEKQYLRAYFTVAGGSFTGGKIWVGVVKDLQSNGEGLTAIG